MLPEAQPSRQEGSCGGTRTRAREGEGVFVWNTRADKRGRGGLRLEHARGQKWARGSSFGTRARTKMGAGAFKRRSARVRGGLGARTSRHERRSRWVVPSSFAAHVARKEPSRPPASASTCERKRGTPSGIEAHVASFEVRRGALVELGSALSRGEGSEVRARERNGEGRERFCPRARRKRRGRRGPGPAFG